MWKEWKRIHHDVKEACDLNVHKCSNSVMFYVSFFTVWGLTVALLIMSSSSVMILWHLTGKFVAACVYLDKPTPNSHITAIGWRRAFSFFWRFTGISVEIWATFGWKSTCCHKIWGNLFSAASFWCSVAWIVPDLFFALYKKCLPN